MSAEADQSPIRPLVRTIGPRREGTKVRIFRGKRSCFEACSSCSCELEEVWSDVERCCILESGRKAKSVERQCRVGRILLSMKSSIAASFFLAACSILLASHMCSAVPMNRFRAADFGDVDANQLLSDLLASQKHEVNPRQWLTGVLGEVSKKLSAFTHLFGSEHSEKHREYPHILPDGYFRFIPEYVTTLVPGNSTSWSSPCFSSMSASTTARKSDGARDLDVEIDIEMHAEDASSLLCSDWYLLAGISGVKIIEVFDRGTHEHTFHFPSTATSLSVSLSLQRGLHLFRFIDSPLETLKDLYDTVEMFLPAMSGSTCNLPTDCLDRNLQFLRDYANYSLPLRNESVRDAILEIDESEISSGDAMAILRMDGLGSMLAWGMGAHSSHIVSFLRIDGELYVVESTDKSNCWPKPHIQRNLYKDWLKMAKAAHMNVLYLPLSKENSQKYNATKAAEWFENVAEGLPYGYHNMLWGWIDTANENFPVPLSAELLELIYAWLDHYSPALATRMAGEAFNQRLQTSGLNATEILAALYLSPSSLPLSLSRSLPTDLPAHSFGSLIALPEMDNWVYSDGLSMVCDVFACEMYKHAGIFGDLEDEIQCTEFHDYDFYSLKVFDASGERMPEVCKEKEPGVDVCQIMGPYQMDIPGYNSVAPYARMYERCPGSPQTHYYRPAGC